MIKSISYDQYEIMENILSLHVPQGFIDLDPTYSKGVFYKKRIPEPILKYDLYPCKDGVIQADATSLPIDSDSISAIMFDPPFLATTGKSLKKEDDSNRINKRFGVLSSEKHLHSFYKDAIIEFKRLLKENGVLIFKCQDKVSSGKQYFSHIFIYNEAIKQGFYAKDLFVQIAKNRIVANWQIENQKHARKFHCYWWVFEKRNVRVNYI